MVSGGPSVERMLGGGLGRHARPGGVWYAAGPWAMLALTFSWLVLMWRQRACLDGGDAYENLCYTDITALFYWRGVGEGRIPYLEADLEYPVLTGMLIDLTRRIVNLFGGLTAPGLVGDELDHSAQLFFGISAVLLFLGFAVLVWAHLRMSRPWDALMIAVSPAVMTAALVNWDALVVALTSLALLAWSRRRPAWTGVWLGLGVAAKLYPVLLLVPLALLCLRAGRWRPFFLTAGVTAVTWTAINLPVYLLAPEGWLNFWSMNADRTADLGSIWYVLSLAGVTVDALSVWVAGLMIAGTLALAFLLLFAPRRPRLAQGAFLIVTLFLLVNKVYSPQYVLWLLPLLVLARPRWLDWAVFSVAELGYFVAIWAHIAGLTATGVGGEDRIYMAAVLFRIGVQVWLCVRVVRDVWHPSRDIVRAGGLDDPDGGLLDGRPDAPWLVGIRGVLAGSASGLRTRWPSAST